MSKRAEEAAAAFHNQALLEAEKYALVRGGDILVEIAYGRGLKTGFLEGYEQAGKDIISHIREQIERWMPKDNGEEYIKGERTAFNSVLHLLKEIEEE